MKANIIFAGIVMGAAVAAACSGPNNNGGPAASGNQQAALPSPATNLSAAWHPQAIPDNAMPNPNQPARSFGSLQEIGRALKWRSDFNLGQQGVNSAGQEIGSLQPGEESEIFNMTKGQLMASQESAYLFSSSSAEQRFSTQISSLSSESGLDYVLYGNGWAISYDDANTNALQYAQGIIGGSLVTYVYGQIQGFE